MTNTEGNKNEFNEKLAKELSNYKEVEPTQWSQFAKTGAGKERTPLRSDWWYVRSAAVLNSIFKLGPIGTSKLRKKFGNKKNRGMKPERFYKGSGSVIRKILQQLESAGLVKQDQKGSHKGRVITKEGNDLLKKTAGKE